MVPLARALIGQWIGGYRVIKLLGYGGAGMVFLGVRSDQPSEPVAIKVLTPAEDLLPSEQESIRQRFLREFHIYQRLHHPHIVPIHAFGQVEIFGGMPVSYMILPYLAGGSLAQRMTAGRLPLPVVAGYVRDLADAIDYAHESGVVHRDIKPANVLLDEAGTVLVTDFGIAHLLETEGAAGRLTVTGQVMGTPAYLSPEQAIGQEVGPASDQYSLGVLTYALLAGWEPFQASSLMILLRQISQEPPPKLGEVRPEVPAPAVAAIERALCKRPEERFPTANAFASAFITGLENSQVSTLPNMPSARPTTPEAMPELERTSQSVTVPPTIGVTPAGDTMPAGDTVPAAYTMPAAGAAPTIEERSEPAATAPVGPADAAEPAASAEPEQRGPTIAHVPLDREWL
jgi:serine/threonine-protein kinase